MVDFGSKKLKVAEDLVRSISKETKDKIVGCVKAYIKLFPEEYIKCIDQVNKHRWMAEDLAENSDNDFVQPKPLFEIPENLFTIIIQALDENEILEFKGLKGGKWFAGHFPQFRIRNT